MNVTFLCHCNGSLIVLVLLQEESDQTTSNGPEKMETDHRVRNQLLITYKFLCSLLAFLLLFFIFIFPLVKAKSFFIDSFPKT
mgnify:CR=1 FL=1